MEKKKKKTVILVLVLLLPSASTLAQLEFSNINFCIEACLSQRKLCVIQVAWFDQFKSATQGNYAFLTNNDLYYLNFNR